jgi:large subunit GTPase 1
MRDFLSPITLILSRIDKEVLEAQYKIVLPNKNSNKYTTSVFLQVFASKKGWVTGRGLPNESQASRTILKDYVNGRLVFGNVRPDYD